MSMIQKIKKWFTMIELLVVITIIGLLITTLIPQVWNSQEKSRDISQKAHIIELASALMAYKLDFWEFPISSWFYYKKDNNYDTTNANWWDETTGDRNWIDKLTILKEEKYINTIHKIPHNQNFLVTNGSQWTIYNGIYSLYISDWDNFAIIAPMENEFEWNCNKDSSFIFEILKQENGHTTDSIWKLKDCINESNWTWNYYIYAYYNNIE